MRVVYFESEDEGDGTYDSQIGHAYLLLDDGSTGDEGRELGFITLTEAATSQLSTTPSWTWTGRPAKSGTAARHIGRS